MTNDAMESEFLSAWPARLGIQDSCPFAPPSGLDSPDDWTSHLSLSCMCLTLRSEFPSHATVERFISGRSECWSGSLEWREGTSLRMPPDIMVLWGLVTPEEMAEVIFRALHSLFQQMVIKNLLASWPYSQMVNRAQQ